MINLARSLLLNQSRETLGADALFYVHPGFKPITLSGTLGRLNRALFPDGMSVSGKDCTTQAYMQLLNCPELDNYLIPFGSVSSDISLETRFGSKSNVVTYSNTIYTGSDVAFAYAVDYMARPQDPLLAGLHRWDIHSNDAENVDVTYSGTGLTTTVQIMTGAAAETSAISVLDDYLGFYYLTPSGTLTGTFNTRADTWLQPSSSFIQSRLATARSVLEVGGNASVLFKSPGPAYDSAFQDFKNLYYTQTEFQLRFGGILLAHIYKSFIRWTEEGSNG